MDEKKTIPPQYNEVPTHENPPQYGQPYPQQYPQYQQGGYYSQQGIPITNQPTTIIVNPGPLQNPPPDHMIYSIFVTLCCCWPIGIFAIMKSMESRDATNRGNRDLADTKSRQAKRFGNWALGVGIAMMIFTFVIFGIYIGLVVASTPSY